MVLGWMDWITGRVIGIFCFLSSSFGGGGGGGDGEEEEKAL